VVLASGFVDDKLQTKAEAVGVQALILKSIKDEAFCALINRLTPAPAA
jgi:hypothetical protein